MSEFEIEDTKAIAKGMGEEQKKVFLTEVDDDLLVAEVLNRLKDAKNLKKQARAMLGVTNVQV